MSETENDYVATATAEKRLREVLEMRYDGTGVNVDTLAEILLGEAKIEYLPRKKSVSITLVVPANGTVRKTAGKLSDQVQDAVVEAIKNPSPETIEAAHQTAMSELANGAERASVVFGQAERQLGHARFGVFEPTVTSAPEYHEDDYFVE